MRKALVLGQRPSGQARWLALPTRDGCHAERIRRVDSRLLYRRRIHCDETTTRMHRSRERVSIVRPFAPSTFEPLSRVGMPCNSSATSAPMGVRDGLRPCDEYNQYNTPVLASPAALSSTRTRLVVFPRRFHKAGVLTIQVPGCSRPGQLSPSPKVTMRSGVILITTGLNRRASFCGSGASSSAKYFR